MIPGNSRVLTCPYCDGQKEVLSLASGNTFNATYWSDGKMDAPMFPIVSSIQKCPHCSRYFYPFKQQVVYNKDSCTFELGTLSFNECLDALKQFEVEGMSKEEEVNNRILTVFAFNDKYYRSNNIMQVPSKSERTMFNANVRKLLPLISADETPVLLAEMLREIGEFEESKALIDLDKITDDFIKARAQGILQRCEQREIDVFQINF